MTATPRPEPFPPMTVHGLGCQCYPHVSERGALEAIVQAAHAEYRDGLRRVNTHDDLVAALRALVGPTEDQDDPAEYDEGEMWWNHPEWPDDTQLLGAHTAGELRQARALLRDLDASGGAL